MAGELSERTKLEILAGRRHRVRNAISEGVAGEDIKDFVTPGVTAKITYSPEKMVAYISLTLKSGEVLVLEDELEAFPTETLVTQMLLVTG